MSDPQDNENKINILAEKLDKLENSKILSLTAELAYFKEVIDYQNTKIEKLSQLVSEFIKNENNHLLSLSSIQENEVNDDVNQVQDQVEQQVRQHVAHQVRNGQQHNGNIEGLEGNIHPELQVAQAAVADNLDYRNTQGHNHSQHSSNNHQRHHQPHGHHPDDHRVPGVEEGPLAHVSVQLPSEQTSTRTKFKRKFDGDDDDSNKEPKVVIDFIHNPMTVREIYDEYTKGFKGQPPLCELDQRYGKAHWRGDSRSKESKRFQRRKRLCDAIHNGMSRFNKSADEIISYIEEFRGDKSLTWIMNGNLPADLNPPKQEGT